jgi:hypothetical protein
MVTAEVDYQVPLWREGEPRGRRWAASGRTAAGLSRDAPFIAMAVKKRPVILFRDRHSFAAFNEQVRGGFLNPLVGGQHCLDSIMLTGQREQPPLAWHTL